MTDRERRLWKIERLLHEEYLAAFERARTTGDSSDTVKRMVACLEAKRHVDALGEIEE